MTVDSWGVHCCGSVQTEAWCTCCGEFLPPNVNATVTE